MPNNSRPKTITLIAGAAVITLAIALFVNAMSIREFSQPGQDFLSGRSNLRLAVSFLLLTGLALALLVLQARAGRFERGAPRTGTARLRTKAAATDAPAPEADTRADDIPEAEADAASEIISDTAGELRTSVEVIQEELEEILEDEAPADKEHMQSLYDETDRLKKIIASMEQLSRAQAIARAPKKELLQIEPMLKEIIEKTRLAVPDKDITYALECEQGLAMQGDGECISRILENITDNAARFIKGSGTVTLSAVRTNGLVAFSIKDTGPGIRRSQVSHLYERFFRGTGSGIGMGLSIVKELVDACGGKIDVQTAVGKGTTFTVRVPE